MVPRLSLAKEVMLKQIFENLIQQQQMCCNLTQQQQRMSTPTQQQQMMSGNLNWQLQHQVDKVRKCLVEVLE